MRQTAIAAAAVGFLSLTAFSPAQAMPVQAGLDTTVAPTILVSGFCGPYRHRDAYGYCRPNFRPYGYGYVVRPRPYYGYGFRPHPYGYGFHPYGY